MLTSIQADRLTARVYATRAEMGLAAAQDIAGCIRSLLDQKETINMIFAAAPSQNEVLAALIAQPDIPWERIHAFHMDEYVGLPADAPQRFSTFLKNAIFDRVPFGAVSFIQGDADPEQEIARYSALLKKYPADIVCMGIGENGHIAFNDPHEADFNDPALMKKVSLDDVCRMQQVHDGCFDSLEAVPKYALTLTVPALAHPLYQFCVVPAAAKAEAVRHTVFGKIGVHCPATILRTLPNAILYCDQDSGASILEG